MKRKEKITIACGLSLGIFAGACSIVRTIELQSLSSWSSSEVCLTIVCACIPVLRPLYVRIAYGSRGDSSNQKSYPLHDYSNSKKSRGGIGDSQSNNKIYMGPDESILQTTVRMGSDTASEETILRECNEQKYNEQKYNANSHPWDSEPGIKRTRDIKVTTTSRDDEV